MRSRELVTESGILSAPEDFLFIPLVARDFDQLQPPLKTHLVRIAWPCRNLQALFC